MNHFGNFMRHKFCLNLLLLVPKKERQEKTLFVGEGSLEGTSGNAASTSTACCHMAAREQLHFPEAHGSTVAARAAAAVGRRKKKERNGRQGRLQRTMTAGGERPRTGKLFRVNFQYSVPTDYYV